MDDFEKELKLGFLDEAEQSITDVEQSFLSLETDPDNKENINNIYTNCLVFGPGFLVGHDTGRLIAAKTNIFHAVTI